MSSFRSVYSISFVLRCVLPSVNAIGGTASCVPLPLCAPASHVFSGPYGSDHNPSCSYPYFRIFAGRSSVLQSGKSKLANYCVRVTSRERALQSVGFVCRAGNSWYLTGERRLGNHSSQYHRLQIFGAALFGRASSYLCLSYISCCPWPLVTLFAVGQHSTRHAACHDFFSYRSC